MSAKIHAWRHINVCALENGFLNEIKVKEGQAVKEGDLMFKIVPLRDQANPEAELANVTAPFDGIVGRRHRQQGSLLKEGDILTTLSDIRVMWVFFNVPDKQYLEYMADRAKYEKDKIELVLANHHKFPQTGKIGAIEAQIQQGDRERRLPRGFSEPRPPAASWSDRHRPGPPKAA